jgi:thiamine monophosphate synthase
MAVIPPVLGISPGDHGCGRTLTWLVQGSVDGGLKALILRESHLSKAAYVELARRLSPLLGSGLILHASHGDALSIAEASGWGLHLPGAVPWEGARSRVRGLLGASCHTIADLHKAVEVGADYATMSPVFAPLSKPSDVRTPLGIDGLQEAISSAPLPVFALGGITDISAPEVAKTDVYGVASMSYLFPSESDADITAAHAANLSTIMKHRP